MNPYSKKIPYAILIGFMCMMMFFIGAKKIHAQYDDFDIPDEAVNTISAGSNTVTAPASTVTAGATTVGTGLTAAQHVKEFLLDGLATNIAREIVRQLTAQTVKWINSGFKGNPAYVKNPEQFFLSVADNAASQTLSSNAFTNSLCSPFSAQVRLALAKSYLNTRNPNYSCSLGKLINNYDNFANNFSNGGWDAWFSVTQNQTNNPYGSFMSGQDMLSAQVGTKQNHYQAQLTQGKGFLSWETCADGSDDSTPNNGAHRAVCLQHTVTSLQGISVSLPYTPPDYGPVTKTATDECTQSENQIYQNGQWVNADSDATNVDSGTDNQLADCPSGQTQVNTPGSVIESQLEKVMGSTADELNVTNSINQIVSALMTQMVSQVVGGIGKGLSGLSQPNPSSIAGGSSASFLDQMATTQPSAGIVQQVVCLNPQSATYTSSCTTPDIAYQENVTVCPDSSNTSYICISPTSAWVPQGIPPTQADLENALTQSGIEQTAQTSNPQPIDLGIISTTTATEQAQQASDAGRAEASGSGSAGMNSCGTGEEYPACSSSETFICPPEGSSATPRCCPSDGSDPSCQPTQ